MWRKPISLIFLILGLACFPAAAGATPWTDATPPAEAPRATPAPTAALHPVETLIPPTGVGDPTETLPPPLPTEEPGPTSTAWPPTPAPTRPALILDSLEPASLPAASGGAITLIGSGFEPGLAVRVVGYGLLETNYASSTLLQAQVPAGVPAGVYSVQMVCQDGRSATFENILTLTETSPTPEPTGEPTPTAGQPVLVVCSSETNPGRVNPGDEFTLSIQICNAGRLAAENGLATFGGGAFVTAGATVHHLGQIPANGFTQVQQRLRTPKEALPGVQPVEVALVANDPAGNPYNFLHSVSVEVASPAPVYSGPAAPSGSPPRLLIASSRTEPAQLQAGEAFSLILTIENLGGREAKDILMNLTPSDKAIPASESWFARLEQIPAGCRAEVSLPLRLSPQIQPGYHPLEVTLEFSEARGGTFTSVQTSILEVQAGLARQPKLILAAYQTRPETLNPGDRLLLTLQIDNVGGAPANQITLTMGGQNGEGLRPFAPLGSGNVKFLPGIPAGGSAAVDIQLILDGYAEARAYPVLVGLEYCGEGDLPQTESQVISLQVHFRPLLQVGFYKEVPPGRVGQSLRLPIEVVNLSANKINITAMEVTSSQMDIHSGPAYAGRLEMGGTFTMEVNATPRQANTLQVEVSLHYLDEYNQAQTYRQSLTIEAGEPAPVSEPNGEETPVQAQPKQSFWQNVLRFLLGIFGLGS